MGMDDVDLKLGSTNPNDGPMKVLDDDRHDAGAKFVLVSAGIRHPCSAVRMSCSGLKIISILLLLNPHPYSMLTTFHTPLHLLPFSVLALKKNLMQT